jgi:membrane protein required for colicin V production
MRGGVYELVATLSWLVAALTSRVISPELNNFFQHLLGFEEPTIGTLIASYFLVFFGVLIIFGLFNQKLRDWIQDSILQITDRALGIIFGILRAILMMGLVYWAMLWYYEDSELPQYLRMARTRPVMQMTANKIHEWFVPGEAPVLQRDLANMAEAEELFQNLIDPAVRAAAGRPGSDDEYIGTGYSESERNLLDGQLLQLGNAPVFEEHDDFEMPEFDDYLEHQENQ